MAILCLVGALGTATLLAGQAQPAQSPASAAPKTAAQAYKNIQVLQDVPADKLIEGMEYISIALGARCEYCHDTSDFANDDKKPKQTARKMMTMLFAIDNDNFNGRTNVSCYTCHQGRQEPVSLAMPPDAAAAAAPAASTMPRMKELPPVAGAAVSALDDIIAKCEAAMGGSQALDRASSRLIEAELTGNEAATEQIYEKAPNKVLIVIHRAQATTTTGFNGTKAWSTFPRGTRELNGMQAVLVPREGQLNPVGALAGYTNKRLSAIAQLGDRKTYVVSAEAPDVHLSNHLRSPAIPGRLQRLSQTERHPDPLPHRLVGRGPRLVGNREVGSGKRVHDGRAIRAAGAIRRRLAREQSLIGRHSA
jgi:hypothetical protein